MPHLDDVHALQIALATALRERDEARARQAGWLADIQKMHQEVSALRTLIDERDALRAEVKRLRAALSLYRHCRHACVECFCVKEARAALAGGVDRG